MNIRQICRDIHYVGVNDRTTEKFEALWPLPYGVSYNSYIVIGKEKTALIDSVSISEIGAYLSHIRDIMGERQPDYLVVNHMEPDHSGSIPEIIRAFPDIRIVGNSKTIDMIGGFYNIDDNERFLEIKDGDSIDLGGHTLGFFLTPMIHWPETMMTYVEDCGVLFSGDAFGTFGALNGGVIDAEMLIGKYISEMYRYYSNIVGKYGRFVEKAIDKLSGLDIAYICPTHGPVWHDSLPEVLDIVKRLAGYRPDKGVVIIYGSMYGNTAQTAEKIAEYFAAQGERNIIIHNAAVAPMSIMISDAFRFDTLIVGSATYSMRLFPAVETLMNALETREIKNKTFAIFGNFSWAKGAVISKLVEFAERMKLPVAARMAIKQNPDSTAEPEIEKFVKDVTAARENERE